MRLIKKQLLKVIRWNDDTNKTLVYRYPMTDREEIMNGCQLVVAESQVAILMNEGQIADVFGPGTHRLETKNLPILTKLASWKYGFDSPFKADVYYINTKQFLDLKWGTSNPALMRDPEFGMIRVRAFGKYSIRVVDAPVLLREVSGTNKSYTITDFDQHLRSILVTVFTDALATAKIAALDMNAKLLELGDELKKGLSSHLLKMGIEATQVFVESVSLPEEVSAAIDKRTQMGIFDDKMGTYVTMETVAAMRDAAKNPGGGLAGAGVGLGAGLTMANQMAQNMNTANKAEDKAATASQVTCPNCSKSITSGSKFCPECGNPMPTNRFCTNCGKKLDPSAKFCAECGTKA